MFLQLLFETGFYFAVSALSRPCGDSPDSHSIVNNPLKAGTGWGDPVGTGVDTMKNTMFKNSLSAP
jgi:hypothetical protein